MPQLISLLGLATMLVLAWLLSDNRRKLNFRLIASGVGLQLILGVLLLKTPIRETIFDCVARIVAGLQACTDAGAAFVFGDGFAEHYFVFSVMPMVIFFSSLTAVLFHLGILQWAVKIMARLMVWVMDVSGSESLCTSANVFVGMTTAPLVIRPYLPTMTRSELMAMMTGGMATVSGATMMAYVSMGANPGHLMIASLMSAPAALVLAKIMVPETEDSPTKGVVKVDIPREDANLLDAACRGASDGLKLVLNITAMLIAFIALIHLANWMLSGVGDVVNWLLSFAPGNPEDAWTYQRLLGVKELTLQLILGWICAPLAWLMGIEWADAHAVGILLGEKTVFNEFVAFQHLGEMKGVLSERSYTITTYALCGFANFASIAVMIGGVSGLAPDRRKDFAKYGLRSMIGGALAAFMTAAVAGMLI